MTSKIFKTKRRIRLGFWGLGRGSAFYRTCNALNMDVVAGCDFNAHMREKFLRDNPRAWATDNAQEFLKGDFDAVLLATFCPAHADDAIACLKAGKHVLSEVTAFHTMAEGVRLVEAVEKSGLVYNMVENYPYTAANMYLKRKWKEGLFGDLMYAEYEYVHEVRDLIYSYLGGKPIEPGNTVHNWRSWLNSHYYNTHSLGPIMYITETRPTRVVALPSHQFLAGYPSSTNGNVSSTLITMSNGGLVRNLMGSTTNDTHTHRLWGTRGAAEQVDKKLRLRLGGTGKSPLHEVIPCWEGLGKHAQKTGHGGGDFWVLYFFAREILEGIPSYFDIYTAADCTIAGILANRSQKENGKPYDVPNFRNVEERDIWRNDHTAQKRYDPKSILPKNADFNITSKFNSTMCDLIDLAKRSRAYLDWSKVKNDMVDSSKLLDLVEGMIQEHPRRVEIYGRARMIANECPGSDGARVLDEMLSLGEEKTTITPAFLARLKKEQSELLKKYPEKGVFIPQAEVSPLLEAGDIRKVKLPSEKIKFSPLISPSVLLNIRNIHKNKDGLVYLRARVSCKKTSKGKLLFGADGPVKIWVNDKLVCVEPKAAPPSMDKQYSTPVLWKKGTNEVLFAICTNHGKAWGIFARYITR